MSKPKPNLSSTSTGTAATEEEAQGSLAPDFSLELKIIESFEKPTAEELKEKQILLGPKTKKNTLILDIDKTLVFSSLESPLIGISGKGPMSFSVKKRPYVSNLLEKVSNLYEILLFTSGTDEYANAIKKCLDPEGKFIKKALGRQSCLLVNKEYYVKDLRIFADRDIKNMVIVDDTIFSFAFNLGNAIPVPPFTGEPGDDELLYLINYLEEIFDSEDILTTNQEKLGLFKKS